MGNKPNRNVSVEEDFEPLQKYEQESGDEKEEEEEKKVNDADLSWEQMINGPKRITPLPCSLCGILMRKRRWRCWDCNRDLCGACYRAQNEEGKDHPHTGHLLSRDQVETLQPARGGTVRAVLCDAFKEFGPRPCFGLVKKGKTKQNPPTDFVNDALYDWYSYDYVLGRVHRLSAALADMNARQGKVIICGRNGLEWIIADLACIMQGVVSVPVNPLFSPEQITAILTSTTASIVLCGEEHISTYLSLAPSSVTHLVQLYGGSSVLAAHQAVAQEKKIEALSLAAVEAKGEQLIANGVLAVHPEPNQPHSLLTIGWTGGTTGPPKGCMIAERSWAKRLASFFLSNVTQVQLVFEPLTHFNGRKQVMEILCRGGRSVIWEPHSAFTHRPALFCSDSAPPHTPAHTMAHKTSLADRLILGTMSNEHDAALIFTSLNALKPNRLFALPMLWNLLYKHYQHIVTQAQSVEPEASVERKEAIRLEAVVAFRNLLGEPRRLVSIQTGSAAISDDVLNWMKELWEGQGACMVSVAYGATETGGICNDGYPVDGVQVKLRDLPELGYTSLDKPWPRGEVLVKAQSMTLGYWQDAETTAKAFLPNGWYATGDVAELHTEKMADTGRHWEEDQSNPLLSSGHGVNARVRIVLVDRVKSLWKVSTGEYLCPEKLEGRYLSSPLVAQVCVIGDASLDFPVPIVVPNWSALDAVLPAFSNEETQREVVLAELQRLSDQSNFLAFERPRFVHLERVPFSSQNGKLTAKLTLHRQNILRSYKHILPPLAGLKATSI